MLLKQVKMHGDNLSYIIADENTKEAAVIDPGFDSDEIRNLLNQENLKLIYIINTHDHVDHIVGEDSLKLRFGAKTVSHRLSNLTTDIRVDEGDILQVGNIPIGVIYTPGHTIDSVCFLVDGKKLLSGDTLLVGAVGRTTLAGGDSRGMYESLFGKILTLADDMVLYPGHEHNGRTVSTLGEEKRSNRALQARSYEEFVELARQSSA
jgi:glyoxylase-like metal-dependent hydrolase (beta-lactamase superfamily II)